MFKKLLPLLLRRCLVYGERFVGFKLSLLLQTTISPIFLHIHLINLMTGKFNKSNND